MRWREGMVSGRPGSFAPSATLDRTAHLFDVSQTEGEALPEFATVTGEPQEDAGRPGAFIAGKGIVLEYSLAGRPSSPPCAWRHAAQY
jgi:hypothetical protein